LREPTHRQASEAGGEAGLATVRGEWLDHRVEP
jgi:hypothetical protein